MGQEVSAPAPPLPLRVLLVEDNELVAYSLAALLRRGGHRVDVAHTGAAALEAACASPPQLALVDIGLPDMTGYQLAARLRAGADGDGILLVAVSGQSDDETRRLAAEAGFTCHLAKPVSFDGLHGVLAMAAVTPAPHASA